MNIERIKIEYEWLLWGYYTFGTTTYFCYLIRIHEINNKLSIFNRSWVVFIFPHEWQDVYFSLICIRWDCFPILVKFELALIPALRSKRKICRFNRENMCEKASFVNKSAGYFFLILVRARNLTEKCIWNNFQ